MTLAYETPPAARLPNGAWRVVALLFVVALLNYLDRNTISTMRGPIRDDMHVTDAQFGLFTSVFLWSYAACSPLGGFLADRFGRRRVILTSLFFWSIATAASGLSHTAGHMMLARVLMGVSEACYIPAALSLISDYHRGSTRSLATGLHMIGLYAGSALGGVGGVVADHWGWRIGFYLFGGIGVLYFAVLALTLFDAPRRAADEEANNASGIDSPDFGTIFASLFTTGGFYVLLAINVLIGLVNWTANSWMPAFFKEQFKLGNGPAGLYATIPIQIASLCGVIVAGVIADRWSRRHHRARALVPALGWFVAGPCVILAASTGNLWIAVAGLAVFGIGRGAFDANQMPIVRQLVNERYSATAYGFLNFIGTSVGGAMVYIGGRLKDADPDAFVRIFQGCGICLIVVGVLLFLLRMPRLPIIGDEANDFATAESASLGSTGTAAKPI